MTMSASDQSATASGLMATIVPAAAPEARAVGATECILVRDAHPAPPAPRRARARARDTTIAQSRNSIDVEGLLLDERYHTSGYSG